MNENEENNAVLILQQQQNSTTADSSSVLGVPPLPPPLLPLTPSLKLRPLPPPLPQSDSEDDQLSTSTIRTSLPKETAIPIPQYIHNNKHSTNGQELNQSQSTNQNIDQISEITEQKEPNYPPPPPPIQHVNINTNNNNTNNNNNGGGGGGGGGRDIDAQRRRKEERKKKREREAAAEHLKQLEGDARRFFIYGFFALPLLWLVSLLYFHREHKDANASPIIKDYYKKSRLMLIIYTIIFATWFILFQIFRDELKAINILSVTGQSPTGGS